MALTVQNVFPLLVICLSLFIAHSLQTVADPPPLELSPHLFFAKSHFNYLFTGGYYSNMTDPYVDSLFQPCGVAAHGPCSPTDLDGASNCYKNNSDFVCTCDQYPRQQYSCACDSCKVTPDNDHQTPSCYNATVTGSRVLNLTRGYDASDPDEAYVILHDYLLRSSSSFIEQRYGGVTFGHWKGEVAADVDRLNAESNSTLPFLATHSVAKAWYSFKGYHAMPAYLNTLNNAILRGSLKQANQSEYGVYNNDVLVF
jgi:hypothetical protein